MTGGLFIQHLCVADTWFSEYRLNQTWVEMWSLETKSDVAYYAVLSIHVHTQHFAVFGSISVCRRWEQRSCQLKQAAAAAVAEAVLIDADDSLRFLHAAADRRPPSPPSDVESRRIAISLVFYRASIIFADVAGITSEVPDRRTNDASLFLSQRPSVRARTPLSVPVESTYKWSYAVIGSLSRLSARFIARYGVLPTVATGGEPESSGGVAVLWFSLASVDTVDKLRQINRSCGRGCKGWPAPHPLRALPTWLEFSWSD